MAMLNIDAIWTVFVWTVAIGLVVFAPPIGIGSMLVLIWLLNK